MIKVLQVDVHFYRKNTIPAVINLHKRNQFHHKPHDFHEIERQVCCYFLVLYQLKVTQVTIYDEFLFQRSLAQVNPEVSPDGNDCQTSWGQNDMCKQQ